MVDMVALQSAFESWKLVINGITIILMIVAASMAIKKKNNLALLVAVVGNLAVYYFTQSPLLSWIVSIACIIWVSKSREAEQSSQIGQSPKTSRSSAGGNKKMGNIIGLILGIGFVVGPLIGYLNQEASLSDPTTQGVLILIALIGAFMIMNNLFKLFEKNTSALASIDVAVAKPLSKLAKEESETNKIRCRFCKKLYSSEYNGCPYCKKK